SATSDAGRFRRDHSLLDRCGRKSVAAEAPPLSGRGADSCTEAAGAVGDGGLSRDMGVLLTGSADAAAVGPVGEDEAPDGEVHLVHGQAGQRGDPSVDQLLQYADGTGDV